MLIEYIYYTGVFFFAVSGALAAARKQLDWVGATALALTTALAGGSFRDLIIGRDLFWVSEPIYIWISVGASLFTIIYLRYFKPPNKSLRLFDAIGLAFFTILGAQITSQYYDSIAIIVLLSLFTGVLGGVVRDILSNEIPYVFRASESLYSISSLAGVLVYLVLLKSGIDSSIVHLVSITTIIVIRLSSLYFDIKVPPVRIKHE